MIVLGLTGSIGMGKSSAAHMLRHMGVPVHDSDATVHELLARDAAVRREIAARFPAAAGEDGIDRKALGAAVFGDPDARRDLEAILHPRVRAQAERFLDRHRRMGSPMAVLDLPLLYETGSEGRVDAVLVVSAPGPIQRRRVLSRPGMDAARFENVLAAQLPDAEKRRRADFVVETGLSKSYTYRQLKRIVLALRNAD